MVWWITVKTLNYGARMIPNNNTVWILSLESKFLSPPMILFENREVFRYKRFWIASNVNLMFAEQRWVLRNDCLLQNACFPVLSKVLLNRENPIFVYEETQDRLQWLWSLYHATQGLIRCLINSFRNTFSRHARLTKNCKHVMIEVSLQYAYTFTMREIVHFRW